LPTFNATGYLQAYVADLVVDLPVTEAHTNNNNNNNSNSAGAVSFTVILVAQPQDLQNLIKGKSYLQKVLLTVYSLLYYYNTLLLYNLLFDDRCCVK
jgi:hypothetical protein